MLTGIHVAFIGGDARQVEVIKKCSAVDATISLIGFNQLQSEFPGASKRSLSPDLLANIDACVLPITGISEDGLVDSVFSDHPVSIGESELRSLPKHCVVYTGITNDYLTDLTNRCHLTLVPLLDRDEIAIYNSIPTAEGAIMMAIQHSDFTLHGSTTAVLGFGRVGMTLARMLNALGSNVRVGSRDESEIARIYEMGLHPFHVDTMEKELSDCDVIFNTVPAPAKIVSAQVIAGMQSHALIIDLASKPGGTDFRYAERRGIKAVLAPGLPGIVAPKTAGQILANVLSRLIIENYTIRREDDGTAQ